MTALFQGFTSGCRLLVPLLIIALGPAGLTQARQTAKPPDPTKPDVIRPGDRLRIEAAPTLPGAPLHGVYRVEPSGKVPLGPAYGRVPIGGKTLEEAEKIVQGHLLTVLKEVKVQITRYDPELRPSRMMIEALERRIEKLEKEVQRLRSAVERSPKKAPPKPGQTNQSQPKTIRIKASLKEVNPRNRSLTLKIVNTKRAGPAKTTLLCVPVASGVQILGSGKTETKRQACKAEYDAESAYYHIDLERLKSANPNSADCEILKKRVEASKIKLEFLERKLTELSLAGLAHLHAWNQRERLWLYVDLAAKEDGTLVVVDIERAPKTRRQ